MAKKTEIYKYIIGVDNLKKKKSIPVLLLLLIFSLLGWFLYNNIRWLGVNPYRTYQYDNVSSATRDINGNTYVIADSGNEILKISDDGTLIMKITGADADFKGATHISCSRDEKLYVHTVDYSTGVRISGERIICIDSETGEFIKSVRYISGSKNDMMQDFAGFVPTENGMLFILKEATGLYLYNQNNNLIKKFRRTGADREVISAAYDEASDTLLFSTFSGRVFTITGKNEAVKRYDSADVEDSIPQDVCIYNGVFYMADVGRKNVVGFSVDDYEPFTMEEVSGFDEREVAAVISAGTGGATVVSESSVYDVRLDGVYMQAKPVLSAEVKLLVVSVWAAILINSAILAFLLVSLIKYLISHSTFGTKLALGIIIGVFAVAALFLGTVLPSFTEQFTNEIYSKEQLAAKTALEAIGTNNLLELGQPSDAESPVYEHVRKAAKNIFFSGEIDDFYCMIYMKVGDYVRVVYTLEDIYYGYPSEYITDDLNELQDGVFVKSRNTSSQGSYLYVQLPFADAKGEVAGFVEVGMDTEDISDKNRRLFRGLIVNILAMVVIVVLFTVELVSFLHAKEKDDSLRRKGINPDTVQPELFRFIVFLVFFFTNLTCAILPIYALKMANEMNFFGISPELLSAIPISAEVFSGAVFSAIGGKVIRKIGNKKAILLSSLFFTAGFVFRVVPNLFTLTLGSLFIGSGWGIQLLMVNVLIAKLPEEEKNQGYTHFNIASVAGANSAIVLGGFLVQWLDYWMLFMLNALTSVALYYVSRKYLIDVPIDDHKAVAGKKRNAKAVFGFVFKPKVMIFFLFMLSPILIAGYFLYYLFPIIGSEWGITDTYIGYLLVVYGLCSVVFGKKTTEFFSKGRKKNVGLFCAACIYVLAFFIVARGQSRTSLYVALLMLGVADSFGMPLLSDYFTDLKEVSDFGYDKAFGVYSVFDNVAQSLGSFVFSSVLVVGVEKGLNILIVALSAMAVVFFVSSLIGAKKSGGEKHEEAGS